VVNAVFAVSNIVVYLHIPSIMENMKRLQAYKYELMPNGEQQRDMRRFAGACRFVWNHALNLRQVVYEYFDKENLNYVALNKHLTFLKQTNNFGWLKNATASVLTQKLIDLDTAIYPTNRIVLILFTILK